MNQNSKNSSQLAIRAGIGYTIGNYFIKGLSFVTIPIFTRLLSTTDYGKYNTFNAYESVLYILVGCAIHSSYKNARYKYTGNQNDGSGYVGYGTYVSNSYLVVIAGLFFWLLLFLLFHNTVISFTGFSAPIVILLLLNSFSTAVITCFNTQIAIDYQYKKYVFIAILNAVLNIVLSIVLITTIFSTEKYIGRIIGTVLPVLGISVYIIFEQFYRFKPKNIRSTMKWGLRYSFPIVPHGLSQIVLSSFDRIMISAMISNAAAGIYSFSYNIFAIVSVTAKSIDNVWGPWFYKKMNSKDYESIRKYSGFYLLFLLILCLLIMFISPELIALLGPKEYKEAILCVIPLIMGGFFAFAYTIPATIEYYFEKTKYIAIATSIAALINIVLNYICIKKWGYIAAAYTTLITYLLYFVFHCFVSIKLTEKDLLPIKAMGTCSAVLICGGGIALVLIEYRIVRWLVVIFIAGAFLLAAKKSGLLKNPLKRRNT